MSTIQMYSKSLFRSKVFWVNALVILAGLMTQLTELKLGFTEGAWFVEALAVINIVLRLLTNRPVTLKDDRVVEVPRAG